MKSDNKRLYFLKKVIGVILFDIVIVVGGLFLDGTTVSDSNTGHGVPIFSFFALFIALRVTVIVLLKTVIKMFKKPKNTVNTETITYSEPVLTKKKTHIPLRVFTVPLSVLIVFACGYFEINAFYSNPHHVGFAIPIVTFLLAFARIVVNVIILIVTLIVHSKRNKQNRL